MKRNHKSIYRKVGFLLAVIMCVLLGGCSKLDLSGVNSLVESGLEMFGFAETETESELSEGQRKADITVVSIVGNELTYYEEETEAETEIVSELLESEGVSEAETEEMSDMRQMGNGEMPDMRQMGSGEMPDMSQMGSGEMPDMSQFGNGEMPDMRAMSGGDSESGASGRMQGGRGSQVETKTVYLPVSVAVHTGTTSTATFSILEAGDELTVLYETNANGEEVITEIWMKGSSQ